MFARSLDCVLAAALPLLASCSGGNAASELAKPPVFEPKDQTKCGVTKSQAKPLIVEWPSSDRAALEAQMRRGLVPVRYLGCEMEVLAQCRAPGSYKYAATERKDDRVTIKDEDDLYANVPLGAVKLEATLKRAGELNVAMTIVGRYEADKTNPKPEELDGTDCAKATHVITAITVGAFDFFAGADASVGGGASVAGAGAGARSAARRDTITRDGNEKACEQASRKDAEPPVGCGAFLRVEVVPIKAPAPALTATVPVPAAAGPAAPPPSPAAASRAETLRAAGLVWQEEPAAAEMNWADAKAYCASLGLAGGGWKLPTRDELKALYNINAPAPGARGTTYWSSTLAAAASVWRVDDLGRSYGGYVGRDMPGDAARVRCVR